MATRTPSDLYAGAVVLLLEQTGGRLVTLAGQRTPAQRPVRDPVRVNLLLREFLLPAAPPPTWRRAATRPQRALFVSSPIGLGHARRDIAIARELRRLQPGLEIDWLAQPPSTAALAAAGERVHPASAELAAECAHIEAESAEHRLPVFDALRRMDEILVANFMLFHDVARDGAYDLWIGDEAWEVDHFLHENPELKSAPYVWLTDFVGYLPLPEGGDREAFLTADYNAEMIEQIARYPGVRDRAIFVGDPGDIVAGRFGPGLPEIRPWVEAHYEFSGHITGFEALTLDERADLRRQLGWGADELICLVAVGGSGVGAALLQTVLAAAPAARRSVPALRMVGVCGPRIDPSSIDAGEAELHGHVADLHRWLDACDIAVVQGGLTTTMELVAAGRPFLRFPLARHFEQRLHVAHRLARHGAAAPLEFADATPETIAQALAGELRRSASYRPVPAGGAGVAAALIAPLLGKSLRCGVGRLAPPGGGGVIARAGFVARARLAVREDGHDAAVRVAHDDADLGVARDRVAPCLVIRNDQATTGERKCSGHVRASCRSRSGGRKPRLSVAWRQYLAAPRSVKT